MKTLTDLIEAYTTLGKDGHELIITDGAKPTAILNRIAPRSKLGYKKVYAYRFKDMVRLEEYCTEHYNNQIKFAQDEINRKEALKIQNAKDSQNVQIGDIFCYSWGYDQTNVDFFQVTVKKGNVSVVVRQIHSETVEETSWASENCRAVIGAFIGTKEETVKLQGDYFKRSCGSARKMENPTDTRYRSWYA